MWEALRIDPKVSTGDGMQKHRWIVLGIFVVAIVAIAGFYAEKHWRSEISDSRKELLARLPADADAIVYIDATQLHQSEFLQALIAWAAKPNADPDYMQFVKNTGFDYERDLDAVAMATKSDAQASILVAVAKGKFDKKKIAAFAERSGTKEMQGGREIFHVPLSGEKGEISFFFIGSDVIELSNAPSFAASQSSNAMESSSWRARFERLAGSPIFAVIRRDASTNAIPAQGPGGFQSPQLASLLNQLSWISIAGVPDGSQMQVVCDGETTDSSLALQLSDFLNGLVVMGEAGLNDPKVQQHLDHDTSEAYMQVLKTADISRVDRGATKSVRVVLSISPKLLATARTIPDADSAPAQSETQVTKKKSTLKNGTAPKPSHNE
jgi:hypothetical protein